ncbi:hypothetical protein L207DRAFT_284315 [Hyaloscypha variabilis F]|uniref:Uncharacterized protein n=1 Tax=Hyaloscypha variabilis (strain UAMH 11265 / GT02V1 / F) TaxID=1149755 RepID=A0A2J6S1H6_HYAVF|nr:hypothetical protein L207DRAFT_284315 [Hyaloscypha variabilis F]
MDAPLHQIKDRIRTILHLKPRSQRSSSPPPLSPISHLPHELLILILSHISSLSTLTALTHSIPAFHRAFHSSPPQTRNLILRSIIEQEVSPSLLVEIECVFRARGVRRGTWWFGEVRELCGRVEWLTKEFCRDALRPVGGGGGVERGEMGKISEMEKHRIQRALYRFETFVALFGEKEFRPSYRREFRHQEMAGLYFGTGGIKAWEVEELACVRDWMFRVYGGVLRETRGSIWEMDLETERDELRCFMLEGRELEERAERQVMNRGEDWEKEQREVLLMLGLPFLARILKAKSVEEKFALLEPYLIVNFADAPDFLTEALKAPGVPVHGHRRRRVEFEGDVENGPNLAWVLSKKNRDPEERERWFEDLAESWREWGYCLWDEKRLKGWGISDSGWRHGKRWEKGRWVCVEQARRSGRVVPRWVWAIDKSE